MEGSAELEELLTMQDKASRTAIQYAAEAGNIQIVQQLMRYRDRMEKENYSLAAELAAAGGMSKPCLLTVWYGLQGQSPDTTWEDRLPLCQASEASVTLADWQQKTPLHHAAENAKVNAPDADRETPLHDAARKGDMTTIKLLLENKADIEACSRTGKRALHLAVTRPEAVQVLLSSGADPNSLDSLGNTPLHLAAQKDCPQSIVREFFIGSKGRGILTKELSWAIKQAASVAFEYLLGPSQQSADNYQVSKGDDGTEVRLLHEAAAGRSPKTVDLLLHSGVDVAVRIQGSSSIHAAAEYGREENVRILLRYKASVDVLNRTSRLAADLTASLAKASSYPTGWTAIHASADSLEATKLLVAAQVNPNLAKDDGWTAMHLATSWQQNSVLEFLLENGVHCSDCNVETTRLLIEYGADIDVRLKEEEQDHSLLALAVDSGIQQKLKSLLELEHHTWHLDDLKQAYWKADYEYPKMVRALVEKNRDLLATTSTTENCDALELCLKKSDVAEIMRISFFVEIYTVKVAIPARLWIDFSAV
ncbi:ankyrin repeat-containing domain protein [Stachybotrys elegans]|uniref:Ankyrin repeat-containing domain protein n=1 Tax=Stachybotrys elegans TaxID=80388 RepID=A0A8K0WKB0_9HYPO|nr:ankyrin repeat-containing domain protein [Stachybotrys elegans]